MWAYMTINYRIGGHKKSDKYDCIYWELKDIFFTVSAKNCSVKKRPVTYEHDRRDLLPVNMTEKTSNQWTWQKRPVNCKHDKSDLDMAEYTCYLGIWQKRPVTYEHGSWDLLPMNMTSPT